MKNLKLILILVVSMFIFTSCEKDDYDDRHWEQLIIDPANPDTYEYSYSKNPYAGWETRPNVKEANSENWYYFFSSEANIVTLESSGEMTDARYYEVATDPNYETLIIQDNKVMKENPSPNGVFRIYH